MLGYLVSTTELPHTIWYWHVEKIMGNNRTEGFGGIHWLGGEISNLVLKYEKKRGHKLEHCVDFVLESTAKKYLFRLDFIFS